MKELHGRGRDRPPAELRTDRPVLNWVRYNRHQLLLSLML